MPWLQVIRAYRLAEHAPAVAMAALTAHELQAAQAAQVRPKWGVGWLGKQGYRAGASSADEAFVTSARATEASKGLCLCACPPSVCTAAVVVTCAPLLPLYCTQCLTLSHAVPHSVAHSVSLYRTQFLTLLHTVSHSVTQSFSLYCKQRANSATQSTLHTLCTIPLGRSTPHRCQALPLQLSARQPLRRPAAILHRRLHTTKSTPAAAHHGHPAPLFAHHQKHASSCTPRPSCTVICTPPKARQQLHTTAILHRHLHTTRQVLMCTTWALPGCALPTDRLHGRAPVTCPSCRLRSGGATAASRPCCWRRLRRSAARCTPT